MRKIQTSHSSYSLQFAQSSCLHPVRREFFSFLPLYLIGETIIRLRGSLLDMLLSDNFEEDRITARQEKCQCLIKKQPKSAAEACSKHPLRC